MEKPTKVDRISNLPRDILDNILAHLSLRDVARTSVLSSSWRYKWTNCSQYVFDDKCFAKCLPDKVARWGLFVKIMHQVQSNHHGQIKKFKLSAYCQPNYSDLDQWILFLMYKGVRELIIQDFDFIKRYRLPAYLFFCPPLNHLELFGCVFKLPDAFGGFSHLLSLHLTDITIDNNTLEKLISICPVLEKLTLLKIDNLTHLKIQSPSLKHLKIHSKFEDICLDDSPLLTDVDICWAHLFCQCFLPHDLEHWRDCNLNRILGCLNGIRVLTLSGCFLEFLAIRGVPAKVSCVFNSLMTLELKELRFNSLSEVMVSLSILGSSPNLEALVITVCSSNNAAAVIEFLKAQYLLDDLYLRLRVVRLRGSFGTVPGWEFIKLLLARSPVLEMMTIVTYTGERIPESLFLEVGRASDSVKIVCMTL